jgi:4-amino-4-deoxy-L-arabinose transferase-like glycosyltransferase
VRAVQSGRLRWLLGAAVLVGLAFNTKMLAVGIVVPGLAAAYALLAPHRWRARLAHVGLAGVVLVLVSGAWIAAVDLTPAVDRPYVGSTTDNSALSLALGYNGLGRVTGQEGGTSVGGGLGGAFSGTPGPLRLLNDALGDQGAWLLPLAIVGGLVALGLALRARRRPELATLTVLGGWFVAGAAVFSLSSGIIHTYYLSALAPATAALVGIGALALWRNARAGGRQLAFPLLALVATCWLEVALLRRSDYLPWLQALAIATTVAAALALALLAPGGVRPDRLRRLLATGALGIGLAGLLAAPAAWAATTLKAPVNGVFPGPGRASSAGSRRAAGHAASRADGSAAAARPRSSARGASLPRPEGSRASHPRPAASGPAGASRAGAGPVRPRAARSRTRLPTSAPTARRSASR